MLGSDCMGLGSMKCLTSCMEELRDWRNVSNTFKFVRMTIVQPR